MHDLVRLHAAEQAAALPAALVEGALLRLARALPRRRRRGRPTAARRPGDPARRDWLDPGGPAAPPSRTSRRGPACWRERPTLLALAGAWQPRRGPSRATPCPAAHPSGVPAARGHWSDYGALAELAGHRHPDRRPAGEALALIALNGIDQRAGGFADAAAKLDRALPRPAPRPERVGEASVLSHYGHLHQQAGEHRRALER
ncbi:hypothetical protein GCM10020229_57970 [Kitasatospora albolonga]|uniref:hypothetical protein n=1 Tax=Kitasatospora albolonga TaxID=68173 RepID=UPI0031EB3CB8